MHDTRVKQAASLLLIILRGPSPSTSTKFGGGSVLLKQIVASKIGPDFITNRHRNLEDCMIYF